MGEDQPAIFVADAPGLDFLNSIATPVDTPVDWIGDGDGLLDWLKQAQLVPDDALKSIRAQALPGELDNVADQARSLREWFRTFVQKHKGAPLTSRDLSTLGPLNRLLERDETFSRIESGNSGLALQTMRKWRSPESLLLPIGEALARFVCTEDFSNVKACEGPRLHPAFRRSHTRAFAALVQHGDVRKPRKTGRASASAQARTLAVR